MVQDLLYENKDISILIVDDQPYNIKVLEEILKKEKYGYSIATNADETYQSIDNRIPDLVLLDIMLPGEDGFEICKKMKANAPTADVPIIFLSAKVELEDKIRGFKLGAVDYVTKPFQPIEVTARINTHLQLKKTKDYIKQYNDKLEEIIESRTKDLIKSEKQAAFGQLMQGIIHNLRGPISSVISSFTLIEYYKEDLDAIFNSAPELKQITDAKLKEIWGVLEQDEKMLNKLIKTMDAMMIKSRSDKSEVMEVVDLNDLIRQEIEFMNADFTFNKIHKNIEISNVKFPIKVIPGEISQVFENLVRNSLDAMFEMKEPKLDISTGTKGAYCWFAIEDNGHGIPDNIIDKIFDPFYTTKQMKRSDVNDTPTGTGIGLHFSKQTIESYSGKVELKTQVGVGTTFTIYLPLAN